MTLINTLSDISPLRPTPPSPLLFEILCEWHKDSFEPIGCNTLLYYLIVYCIIKTLTPFKIDGDNNNLYFSFVTVIALFYIQSSSPCCKVIKCQITLERIMLEVKNNCFASITHKVIFTMYILRGL